MAMMGDFGWVGDGEVAWSWVEWEATRELCSVSEPHGKPGNGAAQHLSSRTEASNKVYVTAVPIDAK